MVATIEEAKNLSILSVDELMGLLQARELRINRSSERIEEKALQVKEKINNEGESIRLASRSRGRGGFRNFHGGHGNWGRWRNNGQRQFNEQINITNIIQCYHYRKYGHIKAGCWYKYQQMNFADENEE